MKYSVECEIKTANTNLICTVEIYEVSRNGDYSVMDWESVGGRLDIGAAKGRWFYWAPKGEHKGVILFPHKAGEDSHRAFSDADRLVTLNDVPNNFTHQVGCGNGFSGEGTLHRTNEKIYWKMYLSCS